MQNFSNIDLAAAAYCRAWRLAINCLRYHRTGHLTLHGFFVIKPSALSVKGNRWRALCPAKLGFLIWPKLSVGGKMRVALQNLDWEASTCSALRL
jgi:hypothetical protein